MDHLYRELAPIPEAAWEQIESEAKGRLVTQLAARKLVDLSGPHGWNHSATDLGRVDEVASPSEGVAACSAGVLPLVELRADFSLSRRELDDADRGADDIDLPELDEAVRPDRPGRELDRLPRLRCGRHPGHHRVPARTVPRARRGHGAVPQVVAQAVDVLRSAGIGGPYGLAIDPEIYTGIVETAEHGGLLLFDHLRQILDGPLVWSPGVQGGIVLSLRGGDFVLESGQDLSIGYSSHDADVVRLYIEESFNFRVLEPDAAVALRRR